jgi:subtilase family serine protease
MDMQPRFLATTIGLVSLVVAVATAGPAAASTAGSSGTGPSPTTGTAAGCDGSGGRSVSTTTVSCSAVELDNTSTWHGHHIGRLASQVTPAGYGPVELQQAYNLTTASARNGRGETVAIVDAYDDPEAASDLAVYRATWGLPPLCATGATGACVTFTKVNQRGDAWPLPATDPGWAQEISVDVDTVSAVCPNCNILLVEANAATLPDLEKAENTAAAAGPVSIGNSFGVGETSSEANADSAFTHPGIAVTAAAGDNGYGVQYPAASPGVIAVGGTTLTTAAATSRGWSETAWSGDGSGCSAVEPQPRWQTKVKAIKAVCADRAVADVAAVADPESGVAVYDSDGLPGWTVFGGTSVAAQIISAVYALAAGAGSTGAAALYAAPATNFFDVTTGGDGTCGSDLCTATVGWDGPTGLGTPDGTAAF